jgi:hypothetical protein
MVHRMGWSCVPNREDENTDGAPPAPQLDVHRASVYSLNPVVQMLCTRGK